MLEPIIDRRYREAYARAHQERAIAFRETARRVFWRRGADQDKP